MPSDDAPHAPDSSLAALVHLLADDHVEVVEAVRTKLVEMGEKVIPYLQQVNVSHADPKVRVEAKGVLERIRLEGVGRVWEGSVSPADREPDLEGSIFLMARVCYPEMNPTMYQLKLDQMAERIRPRLLAAKTPAGKLSAMNRVLFDEERFQGNWTDYFDPQNCYLNRVLDRKLGIPITLSAVYLLVARRIDFPILGVGVPGHFMVKYRDDETEIYVDPFNGGRLFTRPECVQFIVESGYPYQPEFLDGVGSREILARILRNLILVYVDRHEMTLQRTLSRFLELLDTDSSPGGKAGANFE